MVKISWVKIPGGELSLDFTETQKKFIRQKARNEANCSNWSSEEGELIENYITQLREYESQRLISNKGWFEETLEIEVLKRKYTGLDDLLRVEAKLAKARLPVVVKMKSFFISRYPITCEQCDEFFTRFGDKGLYKQFERQLPLKSSKQPEAVTWHVADMFCHWVGGRLPISMEWNYAARGPEGWLYPWGNEWDILRGNFDPRQRPEHLRSESFVTPVDAYPNGVSPFGVWDMCGNLAEWTMTLARNFEGAGLSAGYIGPLINDEVDKKPYWYQYIISQSGGFRSIDLPPWYIGFRPIKDTWHKRLWPGFDSKAE